VPFVARHWQAVRARYPDIEPARLAPELVRDQIGRMVRDVLDETARRVADAGVETVEDVRAAGRALSGFSEAVAEEERQLKAFLYANMYRSPPILAIQDQARSIIAGLFAAYRADPRLLPEPWRLDGGDEGHLLRRIGDFIAGMTDRYAIRLHRELVGPVDMPDGF
jgi:dGTPase